MSAQFLVVGVGASAGGVEALQVFFSHVPADSGYAYVVIVHLSPEHESSLTSIIQNVAPIPVTAVTAAVRIMPDHVYVASPNLHLTMGDDELRVGPISSPEGRRTPIDLFFRSLAESLQSRAVCVVLSGSGADGSLGLKQVKEHGGAAFVQAPSEAAFAEMPRSAIATDLVDHVLPVADIPAAIVAYGATARRVSIPEEPEQPGSDQRSALRQLFTLLRSRTGHDFSAYKRPTLLRRIGRRIAVHSLADLPAYVGYLREHPEEAQALLRDLLISVTSFFRDREAFATLEQEVLPRLFAGRHPDEQVRIWVVGCATGEEAYSLAMLCAEYAEALPSPPSIQIFATDIDESALARARSGLYTAADIASLSPERQRRFFVQEEPHYRVRPRLRELVLFARHNLLSDPPFSQLDLVSCRNLLIYLGRGAQEQVLETLHFALKPDGFLFLGSAETPDNTAGLFTPVNHEQRLFQRRSAGFRAAPPLIAGASVSPQQRPPQALAVAEEQGPVREHLRPVEVHRLLLEQYAPPSLVVTADFALVHLSDRASRYLQLSGGEPTSNLLALIRPELRAPLRVALFQAIQHQTAVQSPNLTVRVEDRSEQLTLHVRPVPAQDDRARGFLLVLFEPQPGVSSSGGEPMLSTDEPVVRQLEEEVQRLKQDLRSSVEQYEVQTEELKAANEELQALNEELRTVVEQQTTSREELQSVNQELQSVNQELKLKVEEAIQASARLQNLINATDIATIFLDRSLRVSLFTPAVRALFNLIPVDQGRPLADITHRLRDVDVLADTAHVFATLQSVEREVRDISGRTYILRVLPYRVGDDRIGGVVLTFFDITERKRAEAQVQAALEAERVARQDVERASRRTAQLQAITAALADALTSEVVLRITTEHGGSATGASAVLVGLPDAAGRRLEPAAPVGPGAAAASRDALLLSPDAPPARAARSGEPLWLPSREEAEARFPGFQNALARFGDQALASLPLPLAENSVGALVFTYPSPQTFAPEEQAFLLALAQQCAQALERARLYAEVLEGQEQLRRLSQRLLQVQEEERTHLARELHDELGQELTGLRLALELVDRQPPGQPNLYLAEARQTAQELIARVRALSLELHPVMLDDSGLLPALLWLVRRFRERTGITIDLHHQGLEARLPSGVETTAYRVVQEALTNVARHAGVDAATVNVVVSPTRLLIQIQDAGRGFVHDSAISDIRSGGLAGMRERVALLGGILSIETEPGKGTWLTAELPLDGEAP